ncbi:MAG: isoprenylcysteine carboxylmethyltransferase family protein [Coriobacteriaceae bacterium]|nr:isoprenylcysteine carboxylmethyltransferase family protein [Coriobacteriaceae bacterium]
MATPVPHTTNKEPEHLPLYGPGPVYVFTIVALTAAGIALSAAGFAPTADAGAARLPLMALGAALVAGGVALWVAAVKGARIDDGILENRLVTQGAYAIVRNPIYSAFMLACTGALLICGNLWLLALPPVFWAFLTMLMKATEERWLRERYGREYERYCARVNRCIPWFPQG